MNVFFFILIIDFCLSFGINAQNFRPDYQHNYEPDYYDDYSPMNAKPVRNRYEQQIDRLQEEIDLRDSYIDRLEHKVDRLRNHLSKQKDSSDDDYDYEVSNFAISSSKKTVFPHESGEDMTNDEMMDKIIPQVSSRMPEANCMRSCNYLKNVKAAKDALSQYMYLMVCAEGCRKSIPCLNENYCMPVMKENPGFFVQCVSKCELFKIAPKVFKSGRCK